MFVEVVTEEVAKALIGQSVVLDEMPMSIAGAWMRRYYGEQAQMEHYRTLLKKRAKVLGFDDKQRWLKVMAQVADGVFHETWWKLKCVILTPGAEEAVRPFGLQGTTRMKFGPAPAPATKEQMIDALNKVTEREPDAVTPILPSPPLPSPPLDGKGYKLRLRLKGIYGRNKREDCGWSCPKCCGELPHGTASLIRIGQLACPLCGFDKRRCACGGLLYDYWISGRTGREVKRCLECESIQE